MAFFCPNCNAGYISDRAMVGRQCAVRYGLEVPIPASFILPSCETCADYSVPQYLDVEFDTMMIPAMYRHVAQMCQDVRIGFPEVVLAYLRAIPAGPPHSYLSDCREPSPSPSPVTNDQLLQWVISGGSLTRSRRLGVREGMHRHLLELLGGEQC